MLTSLLLTSLEEASLLIEQAFLHSFICRSQNAAAQPGEAPQRPAQTLAVDSRATQNLGTMSVSVPEGPLLNNRGLSDMLNRCVQAYGSLRPPACSALARASKQKTKGLSHHSTGGVIRCVF